MKNSYKSTLKKILTKIIKVIGKIKQKNKLYNGKFCSELILVSVSTSKFINNNTKFKTYINKINAVSFKENEIFFKKMVIKTNIVQ